MMSFFLFTLCVPCVFGGIPHQTGAWLTPPLSDWVARSPLGMLASGVSNLLTQSLCRWLGAWPPPPPGTCLRMGSGGETQQSCAGNRPAAEKRLAAEWPPASAYALQECQECGARRRGQTEERRKRTACHQGALLACLVVKTKQKDTLSPEQKCIRTQKRLSLTGIRPQKQTSASVVSHVWARRRLGLERTGSEAGSEGAQRIACGREPPGSATCFPA